jgi:hypothetical protein
MGCDHLDVFDVSVTFDHEPTTLSVATASRNLLLPALQNFATRTTIVNTIGGRKTQNSLSSERVRKHREHGRQSDDSIEANRERNREHQRHKRKVAQQKEQELANAKAQLAILRRQNEHL